MDVPRVLALHRPIGVAFNFRGLGRSVHFLGLKAAYPFRGCTSVAGHTPVQIGVMLQDTVLVHGVRRGGAL